MQNAAKLFASLLLRRSFVVSLIVVCLLLSATSANAATSWFVRITGSDSHTGKVKEQAFRTIQHAASQALAGDTIYVGAGTYSETVTPSANNVSYIADRTGTYTSDNGTILVNPAAGNGFVLSGKSGIVLDGFTFSLSGAWQSLPDYTAVYSYTASLALGYTITLRNLTVTNHGRGLYSVGNDVTIDTCTFSKICREASNTSYGALTVTNSTVTDAQIGIIHQEASTLVVPASRTVSVTNTTLTSTTTYGNYGIYAGNANLSHSGGTISGFNYGVNLLRGAYTAANSPTYTKNVYGLRLDGNGLGLDGKFLSTSVTGVTISNQTQRAISAVWYNLTVTNCTTNSNGDLGVCVENGQLTATNCTSNSNYRGFYNYTNDGTTNWQQDSSFNQGTVKLTNCTATGNKSYGVQVYCAATTIDGGTYTGNNYGLFIQMGQLTTLDSPSISNNFHNIYLIGNTWNRSSPLSITLSGLTFTGAKYECVRVENYNVTATNCNFSNNDSGTNWTDENGNARSDRQGTGLLIAYGSATTSNCTFSNNGVYGLYLYDYNGTDVTYTYNWTLNNSTMANNGSIGVYHYNWRDSDPSTDLDCVTKGTLAVNGCTITGNGGYGLQAQGSSVQFSATRIASNTSWGLMATYAPLSLDAASTITANGGGVYLAARWWKQLIGAQETISLSNVTITGNNSQNLNIQNYNVTLNNVTLGDSPNGDWALYLCYSQLTATNLTIRNSNYGIYFNHYDWNKNYAYNYSDQTWYNSPGGWYYTWMHYLGVTSSTSMAVPNLSLTNSTLTNVTNQPLYTYTWNSGNTSDLTNRTTHLHNDTLTNVSFTNCGGTGNWAINSNQGRLSLSAVTINGSSYGVYNHWGQLSMPGAVTINGPGINSGTAFQLDGPLQTSLSASNFSSLALKNFNTAFYINGFWPDMWSPTHGNISITGVDFSKFTGINNALNLQYIDTTLTSCTIANCGSLGVYSQYGALTLSQCTITNNNSYGVYSSDENWVKRYFNEADKAYASNSWYLSFKNQYSPILTSLGGRADGNRTMSPVTLTGCTVTGNSVGLYSQSWNSSWDKGLKNLADSEWSSGSYANTVTLNGNTFSNTSQNINLQQGNLVATLPNQIKNAQQYGVYLYMPFTSTYTSATFANLVFSNNTNAFYIGGWWPGQWQGAQQTFTISGLDLSSSGTTSTPFTGDSCELVLSNCNFSGGDWGLRTNYCKITATNLTITKNRSGGVWENDQEWRKAETYYYTVTSPAASTDWYYTGRVAALTWYGISPTYVRPMYNQSFSNCTITNNGSYGIYSNSWAGNTNYDFNPTANDFTLTLSGNTLSGHTYCGVNLYHGRLVGQGTNVIDGGAATTSYALLIQESSHTTFTGTDMGAFTCKNCGCTLGFQGWWADHVKGSIRSLTFSDIHLNEPTNTHGIHTWYYNVTYSNCSVANYKGWGFYSEIGGVTATNVVAQNNGSGGLYSSDYNWFRMTCQGQRDANGDAWYNSTFVPYLANFGVTPDMATRSLYDVSITSSQFTNNGGYGISCSGWNPNANTWSWTASDCDQVLTNSNYHLNITNCTIQGAWPNQGCYGIYQSCGTLVLSGTNSITQNSYGIGLSTPSSTTLDGTAFAHSTVTGNSIGLAFWGLWQRHFSSKSTNSPMAISNLQISSNQYGIYSSYMALSLTNCAVLKNTSWGMYCDYSSASVLNSTFTDNANGIYFQDTNWVKQNNTAYGSQASYLASWSPIFTQWNIDPAGGNWVAANATIDTTAIQTVNNPSWGGYGIYGSTWNGTDGNGPRTIGLHANTWTLNNLTIQGYNQGMNMSYGKLRTTGTNVMKNLGYAFVLTEYGETTLDGNVSLAGVTYTNIQTPLYFTGNQYVFWSATPHTYTMSNIKLSGATSNNLMAYYCTLTINNSTLNNAAGWGAATQQVNLTMNNVTMTNNGSGGLNYYDDNWLGRYFYNYNKYGTYNFIPSWVTWLPSYGVDVTKNGARTMCAVVLNNCHLTNNGSYGVYGSSNSALEDNGWDYNRLRNPNSLTLTNTAISGNTQGYGVYNSGGTFLATGSNSITGCGTGFYLDQTADLQLNADTMSHISLSGNTWAFGVNGNNGQMFAGKKEALTLSGFTLSGNTYGFYANNYNLTVSNVAVQNVQSYMGVQLNYCDLNANQLTVSGNPSYGIYAYDYDYVHMYDNASKTDPVNYAWFNTSWRPWLSYLGANPAVARPMSNITLTNCSLATGNGGGYGVYTYGWGGVDWNTCDYTASQYTVSMGNCTISNFNTGVYLGGGTLVATGANTITGNGNGMGIYFSRMPFTSLTGTTLANFGVSGFSYGLYLEAFWQHSLGTQSRAMAMSNVTMSTSNGTGICFNYLNVSLSNVQVSNCTSNGIYLNYSPLTATQVSVTNCGGYGLYFNDYNWLLQQWDGYSQQNLGALYGITQAVADRNLYDATITNSTFTGNTSGGVQFWNINYANNNPYLMASTKRHSNINLQGCTINNNTGYGAVAQSVNNIALVNTQVNSNSTGGGYGIYNWGTKELDMTQCQLNTNASWGLVTYGGIINMKNCLVADNSNGLYLSGQSYSDGTALNATIWNATIANTRSSNSLYMDGGGTVSLTNSIVAGTGTTAAGLTCNGGSMNHSYNLVYGHANNFVNTTQVTTELTNAPPKFSNPTSGDYHLTTASRGINLGTNAAGIVDVDLDGRARPLYGKWDMGCYEFPNPVGVRWFQIWDEVSGAQ